MNIEDYREYCLSLGADVEEKLPFQKFKNGEGVYIISRNHLITKINRTFAIEIDYGAGNKHRRSAEQAEDRV